MEKYEDFHEFISDLSNNSLSIYTFEPECDEIDKMNVFQNNTCTDTLHTEQYQVKPVGDTSGGKYENCKMEISHILSMLSESYS